MSLSSLQLDAFFEVARAGNFSKAAHNLSVTQSALSQRIMNLESSLETTLFIREAKGVRLTEVGENLMRFCQSKNRLEEEVMGKLHGTKSKELSGSIRIGGFSTIVRSVVMPSLDSLVRSHPLIQIELMTREMRDLPRLLRSGEVDIVLLDHEIVQSGIVATVVGYEENVLVESTQKSPRSEIYLDHDAEDQITLQFLKLQKEKGTPERSYLDEIYAILDGVASGWGRAVVPRHLAKQANGVRQVTGYRSLKTPVVMNYYAQAFYPVLFQRVISVLQTGAGKHL